jgi:cold shock CspA family protein
LLDPLYTRKPTTPRETTSDVAGRVYLGVSEDPLPLTSWNAAATSVRGRASTGTITQLTHGRLCGVIRTADGQDVFFHGRDLEGARYNEMELGGAVSFELIDDRVSGARAAKIRRL